MPPHDASTTLVVRSGAAVAPREPDGTLNVVPVWAAPVGAGLRAMLGESRPDVAAALRVIRHRLERKREEGMWTFGVTSAREGEGKSTLAAQLALVLSEAQRARVLLVEASLRHPSLARLLGVQVPLGLGFSIQLATRMAKGGDSWAVLALGPTLHALVESESEPGFPQALHSTQFRRAIERMARAYDWVVVDSPTVLGSGDANVVEEAVDGMIVVARSGHSKGADVRAAVRQLGGRKAIGVVLWDADGVAKGSAG
jgi:Mrp family chromosome partitioning ATPase